MKTYVALLRAINVGGTGKLPMSELIRLCERIGHQAITTYIASGNVVFKSDADSDQVKAGLESALLAHMRKPVSVMVRSAPQMRVVARANPFPNADPKFVHVLFLDRVPLPADLLSATGVEGERLALGAHEIFICYTGGAGPSKMKLPVMKVGTARNMNTVLKLADMAEGLSETA